MFVDKDLYTYTGTVLSFRVHCDYIDAYFFFFVVSDAVIFLRVVYFPINQEVQKEVHLLTQ